MSLLDNIENSQVDVQTFSEMSGEPEIVYRFDGTTSGLFSCIGKPRRIFISVEQNVIDVNEIYPRLGFIPEVREVTPVYAITHMGENFLTFYIGLDLDVRTAYETARVLCSIISLMKVVTKSSVYIYTQISKYTFDITNIHFDIDSLEDETVFFLLVYILGRPVEKNECMKSFSRIKKLIERIRK